MKREKVWIAVRDSFWLIPTIYGLVSIISVIVVNEIDSWIIESFEGQLPQVFLTNGDVAKELYSALVSAILTMTTISFSVIMVVLTTYSTQFSPRTLQDFMRSAATHHILGMYCFGFVFALLHLILVGRGNMVVGPLAMGLVAMIILAFFVYFIHHSARWIQVNNLIAKIHMDGSKVITHAYRKPNFLEHADWDETEISRLYQTNKRVIRAEKSGYVQKVDWKSLVDWTSSHHCTVEMCVQIGDFILDGAPVMRVMGADEQEKIHILDSYFIIGNERTDLQDVEFSLQKLVEIALRAISPAINDPHTAINCINRIGALLSEASANYKEIYYLSDEHQHLRVIKQPKKYEDYLYKSFYQIRHYAKDDVSVLYSLIDVLYKVALVSDETIKRKIWRFHYYILDVIVWDALSELDQQYLQSIYQKFKASFRE
ncbi:DUF2254 domain-containing protein [Lentibacillus sp. N15]|uniref:DUF2254 domain-containing protein n=1 Tax=Lentibacillus songyuanensis TaxID=3136161 RepID=UPI0031BB8493